MKSVRRGVSGQLARFGVVGVTATIVHTVVLVTLVEFHAVAPTSANMAAFASAVAFSYLGNYHWTYASRASHALSLAKFILVALLATTMNYAIFSLLVGEWGLHYLIALFVVIGTLPFVSFTLQRWWVFRGELRR